jgi:hypothetical protein
VWAATTHSLFHFDGSSWTEDTTFTDLRQFAAPTNVTDLLIDPSGELWVSGASDSENGTIAHRTPEGWSRVGGSDADNVSTLARSPSGKMWQAGYQGAVYAWSPATGETPTVVPGLEQETLARDSRTFGLGSTIIAFSDDDVFIGGLLGVFRWNGTALASTFTGPRDNLYGVSASAQWIAPLTDATWVVGGAAADLTRGVAYQSMGGSWQPNSAPSDASVLRSVAQPYPSAAWAVGDGLEVLEEFTGEGWTALPKPTTTSDTLNAVSANDTTMWAVGSHGLLRGSTNGNFNTVTPSGTNNDLNGVVVIGTTDVWAVGSAGTLVHKAGTNAFTAATVGTADLYGICANSAQDLWIVGSGVALRGNGTIWTPTGQGLPTNSSLSKVACAGSAEAWAMDGNSQIYRYSNGTWSVSLSSPSVDLLPVPGLHDIAITPNALWVVGESGTVLRRAR